MGCSIGNNGIFGADKFIKFQGGDAIAVEGPNTIQRHILSDLRFPYEQVLHSKLILKKGQRNYLLNHLGLGDNSTFLLIGARYDPKSRIEEDNYIEYSYYNDPSRFYTFSQALLLTGNSTNRIPQLYLSNPNGTYSVGMEIMVANIDDNYSYFEDIINQSGSSFVGLSASNIQTHVVGESIRINNNQGYAMAYFQIVNINALQILSDLIIIDDHIAGQLFLRFIDQNEAAQGFSLLNYILENPEIDISDLNPLTDDMPPVITFKSNVGDSGDYIYFMGSSSSVPYSTLSGNTFSTTISLLEFGNTQSIITKNTLIDLLIDNVIDNRDGAIPISDSNLILQNGTVSVNNISTSGTYSLFFDINDLALNNISDVFVEILVSDD